MRREEILPWFESIEKKALEIPRTAGAEFSKAQAIASWTTEALSAIRAVFPDSHSVTSQWRTLDRQVPFSVQYVHFQSFVGIFKAALVQIREGRLGSLVDAVRAETIDELLDQALNLLAAGHIVAAAVIAGGALETHLRHLVAINPSLVIQGEGSITKYDGAIAKARNDGTVTIYSVTDSKLATGWGGMRNDAAHDPGAFNRSADDVRRMVEGIREFLARTG